MDQDNFFKDRKQLIYVGKHGFEFSRLDNLFNLSRPVVPHEELATGDIKRNQKFVPICGDSCFCCKELLTTKVKQEQCDFCARIGCIPCVYKKYPFPRKTSKGE